MRPPPAIIAIAGALLSFCAVAFTQGPPASAPVAQLDTRQVEAADQVSTTRHRITIGPRTLSYTARAGLLPIRHNETGDVRGRVFFMAYSLDRQPGEPARPLTFLWNGGPGANSVLVHLVAFGPRRIKTGDDPTETSGGRPGVTAGPRNCDCELEDNQTTWLDKTDLVFVDPIGTGFSRPAQPEYAADFYSTLGDIAATAEFVRVYRTTFDAWEAPLFLGGESFGTWRAAGAAETLERKGIRVAGVMLISGGIVLGSVGSEEMRTALFIPTRTAAAFHHKRLAADLQANLQDTLTKVEAWARDEYAPALARRDQLTDTERAGIVAQLARFTGLDQSLIDRQTLVVARQAFAEQLLKDQQRVLGRFDTRQATGGGEGRGASGRQTLVMRYLRSVLQFKTDLAYQGVEEGWMPSDAARRGVNARWNYNVPEPPPGAAPPPPGPRNTDSPPGAQPWLRRAIGLNPSLKAFVAAGLYDSLNSCAANEYITRTVEPEIARNLSLGCYDGGHMMYRTAAPAFN